MAKIFDLIKSSNIKAYWDELNPYNEQEYIGERLFPSDKQVGLRLGWIKGMKGTPVALQPSAFDTKAALRDRIGISKIETEMPFFREAMRIGEQDRQDLESLLARGEDMAKPAIKRIFDDVKNLIEGAYVQSERMRFSLLSSGTIDLQASLENGRPIRYTYNYDPSGDWAKVNTLTLEQGAQWVSANADDSRPIEDLQQAVRTLRMKRGVVAVEAIMNTATYMGMLSSVSIAKALNPVGYQGYVSEPARLEFLQNETRLKVTLYDKLFVDEDGNERQFLQDGYVILVPSKPVGKTWYGTTPEEHDLLSGNAASAEVSIVGQGIAVTTITEPHPVNVQTIVSEIVLPSFEGMDGVFSLKVM